MDEMPPIPKEMLRINDQPDEEPIASCEIIFCGYANKKGGTFITLKVSESPDGDYSKLATMPPGEILNLYVTKTVEPKT